MKTENFELTTQPQQILFAEGTSTVQSQGGDCYIYVADEAPGDNPPGFAIVERTFGPTVKAWAWGSGEVVVITV